jgi:hypothetical protein
MTHDTTAAAAADLVLVNGSVGALLQPNQGSHTSNVANAVHALDSGLLDDDFKQL